MNRTKRNIAQVAMTLAGALALAICTTGPAAADHRGDDSQRKSKNGKAEGTIGGVKVAVEYGRPSVAGRKIWGDLVPYGQIWRAGADEATTIAFDKDVRIEDKTLAAGRYALFLIPSEGDWTVVFNSVDK